MPTQTTTRRNPWQALAHEREAKYGDPDPRFSEHALIDSEYLGMDEYAQPCYQPRCKGTLFYRSTVGALMCDHCRSLAHCNGTPITPITNM